MKLNQFHVERRILRSTLGQWLALKFSRPDTEWELLATSPRLKIARQFLRHAETGENSQGFFVASAEYRIRRTSISPAQPEVAEITPAVADVESP